MFVNLFLSFGSIIELNPLINSTTNSSFESIFGNALKMPRLMLIFDKQHLSKRTCDCYKNLKIM